MAGPADADIADRVDVECLVRRINAAHGALSRADNVVIGHQCFLADTEQRGVHASRFIDEVGASVTNEGEVVGLLVARLKIDHFRVAHAGACAAIQIIEIGHLAASG